jgi:hypothetical protein
MTMGNLIRASSASKSPIPVIHSDMQASKKEKNGQSCFYLEKVKRDFALHSIL